MVSSNPAIVLGGGSANGVGIARNLGSLGIPVYCVTGDPYEATLFSKYCAGACILPGVEQDPRLLQDTLQRLWQRDHEPGVLFPTTDSTLLTLAAIRGQLSGYTTFIPSRDIIETMVFKSKFYVSLQEHDIPHPATFNPAEESITQIAAKAVFPVFIRPVQSLLFFQRIGGKGFLAHTPRELAQYLQVMRQARVRCAGTGDYLWSTCDWIHIMGIHGSEVGVTSADRLTKSSQTGIFRQLMH